MNLRWYIVLFLVCSGVSGCAADTSEPADVASGGASSENVATASQELTTCNPIGNCNHGNFSTYTATDGVAIGPAVSDYLCYASRLDDYYTNGGPAFRVERGYLFGSEIWLAIGTGTMTCVKQCCFSSNGGANDVRWVSGDITATSNSSTCFGEANAWWADAVTLLQGADFPQMNNSGDYGTTYGGGQTSPVKLRSNYCGTATSYANSFFVGIPGGGHHKVVSNQFHVGYGTAASVKMAKVADAICHFQSLGPYIDYSIAGQNAERWVKIEEAHDGTDYYWYLTRSDPYYYQPDAYARCYYYNQNQ